MTNHPPLGLVDVFSATLPTPTFSPGVHVNDAETVLPMRDGLPKLKDFPKEFGGSGDIVPEWKRRQNRLRRAPQHAPTTPGEPKPGGVAVLFIVADDPVPTQGSSSRLRIECGLSGTHSGARTAARVVG